MSRFGGVLGPLALGAVVAAVGLTLALLLTAPPAAPAAQADALARELRCPDCQGLSVADSPTQSAAEIRRRIEAMLDAGATSADVRAHFVERYGDWILLAPSSPVPWVLPIAVVTSAAVLLVAWLARSARGGRPATTSRPAASVRQRLHDEADALDA